MHQRKMFSTIRVLVFLFMKSSFLLRNLKKTEKGTLFIMSPVIVSMTANIFCLHLCLSQNLPLYLEQRAVFQKDAAGKTRQGNLFPHLLIFVPEDTFDSIAAWCIFCRLEIFLHENIHQ